MSARAPAYKRLGALSLSLALVLLSGCITGRFLERGELYEEQGHEELALATYKQVLDADPSNTRALDGYERICARVLERAAPRVDAAMQRQDYADALVASFEARDAMPQCAAATQLHQKTTKTIQGLKRVALDQGDFARALKLTRQIATATSSYDSDALREVNAVASRWALALDRSAEHAQAQELLALSALYTLKALSLEPNNQREALAHQRLSRALGRDGALLEIELEHTASPPATINSVPGLCVITSDALSRHLDESRADLSYKTRHPFSTAYKLSYTLSAPSCEPNDAGRCQRLMVTTLTQPLWRAPMLMRSRIALNAQPEATPADQAQTLQAQLTANLRHGAQLVMMAHQSQLLVDSMTQAQRAGESSVDALCAAALLGPLSPKESALLGVRTQIEDASMLLRQSLQQRWGSSIGCQAVLGY